MAKIEIFPVNKGVCTALFVNLDLLVASIWCSMDKKVLYRKFREDADYLVKKLRESDENAFTFLFDTYGKSLYFYCNSILKNSTFGKDVVQESFVGLWERRKDFLALLPVRVFLYQTARNKCMDLLKHEQVVYKHEAALTQKFSEDFWDEKMIEEEMLGEIYRAIDELPPECRRVFRLGLEGLSNQEIADSLSISLNTVKTQKQRAMAALKRRFGAGILIVLWGMFDWFN